MFLKQEEPEMDDFERTFFLVVKEKFFDFQYLNKFENFLSFNGYP